ncbi:undecaprenyl-phosphate alpha-N-acetylglucosaminyl 1-phosphate transferase [Arthrobacter sp. UCD-GKA]|uniref:MraY family glycosyltransferase n=1 Tax=Arthrobacter sp. UCD-GKA TaxID=1913576 RepID=UPI0008DE8153|nr:MraY family glycosyltransferase [Arthrobacter sp. UCD-GKA]OIH86927.1 undecaprenyl-phosphate alpha-N-acetylglucosaminyl 1-phosphate transferase [Arthrobacter sp. UCD-GKA]
MRSYLLLIGITFMTSYLLTPVLRVAGVRFMPKAPVRERDFHQKPTPKLGGVAIIGGLYLGILVASQIPFFAGIFRSTESIQGVLIALGIILVMGVFDDLLDLRWWIKLIGQVAVGLVIVKHGILLKALPVGSLQIESPMVQVVVTVLIIVGTMNAINFVDGLDGLAAGISAIGAATFFVYSYLLATRVSAEDNANFSALLCAVLLGATLGFLPHNFQPASIFMGETGVLAIGMLFAVATLAVTGDVLGEDAFRFRNVPAFMPVILPVAVIVLPYVDLLLSVIRRTAKRRSPFSADRGHIHHRLVDLGHSARAVVIILYLWALLVASGVVVISLTNRKIAIPLYVAAFVCVTLVTWWPLLKRARGKAQTPGAN